MKPHHLVQQSGVVIGYSHLGMLAAARWLLRATTPTLREALAANPGYSLRIVGHSMGGGTAAMLTMMLRDQVRLTMMLIVCTGSPASCRQSYFCQGRVGCRVWQATSEADVPHSAGRLVQSASVGLAAFSLRESASLHLARGGTGTLLRWIQHAAQSSTWLAFCGQCGGFLPCLMP